MIHPGLGTVARELGKGMANSPCLHPVYALTYKPPFSLLPSVLRDHPLELGEDYVYCERCGALLAITR